MDATCIVPPNGMAVLDNDLESQRKATNQKQISLNHLLTTPNKSYSLSLSLIFTIIQQRMHDRLFRNRHLLFKRLRSSRPFSINTRIPAIRSCVMAMYTNGTKSVPADASSENAPRKLKILMLHGTLPISNIKHLESNHNSSKATHKTGPSSTPKPAA